MSERRPSPLCFAMLFLLAIASRSMAQMPTKDPIDEGGFKPGQSYQMGGVDDVNLFNGNLTLTIPLGVTYPVGPGLSYQFKLIYSTASWLTETVQRENEPDVTYSLAEEYNAGFGFYESVGPVKRLSGRGIES